MIICKQWLTSGTIEQQQPTTTGLTMKEIATLIEEYEQGYLSAKDRRYIVDKMTGGQTLKGAVIMLIKRDRKRRGAK